ncbi:MAG: helix-turn-helix domain-containing protein [Bacilli bacterium]|nr:helix-turn-helix domain-containing protein [Bacilli bacterium]
MKERIKNLRKSLGMTQQEFANKLGIKRNTIGQYEIGRNEPTTPIMNLICKEFNVNKEWLEQGTGDMFQELTRDEEISQYMADITLAGNDSFRIKLESILHSLDEDGIEFLYEVALSYVKTEDKKSHS